MAAKIQTIYSWHFVNGTSILNKNWIIWIESVKFSCKCMASQIYREYTHTYIQEPPSKNVACAAHCMWQFNFISIMAIIVLPFLKWFLLPCIKQCPYNGGKIIYKFIEYTQMYIIHHCIALYSQKSGIQLLFHIYFKTRLYCFPTFVLYPLRRLKLFNLSSDNHNGS